MMSVTILKFRTGEGPNMGHKELDEMQIKESVKQALVELLQERKDLIYELIGDIIEDYALTRAIKDGEQTPKVSREKVLRALNRHGVSMR